MRFEVGWKGILAKSAQNWKRKLGIYAFYYYHFPERVPDFRLKRGE